MAHRGIFPLAVFSIILCITHVGASYEVTCSGRVIQYTDVDSMKAAVWKRTVHALGVVYGTKLDIEHIQTLNDTIVPRMKSAAYDLQNSVSYLTKNEKENLAKIAMNAEDLYKRIEQYDLVAFSENIKKAEDMLTSINEESQDSICTAESAITIGEDIQVKVKPLREQYQEVYDTLEAFRKRMREYALIEEDRASEL